MSKLFNLARMTTATTGTGTITLGSAVSGYLSFDEAGAQSGDIVTYGINDGGDSEVGVGVYTSSGTTLTRSVLKSTNSDAAISLSGAAEVFITPLAEYMPSRAGELIVDTTGVAPPNCIVADGSLVDRADYPELWARASANAISEASWSGGNQGCYSVGDGSTTFRIPELRGIFIRGLPDSGRTSGSYQDDAFQGHYHDFYYSSGARGVASPSNNTDVANTNASVLASSRVREASSDGTNGTPRTADETRPVNVSYPFYIRYR